MMHKVSDQPLYVRALALLFFIVIVVVLFLVCCYWYFQIYKLDKAEYEIRRKKAEHIKIDEIDEVDVYLIVFDKDTIGAVGVKK